MAPRLHHFHVRVVDSVLGPFRRVHISTRRHVEQQYQGVLRHGRGQGFPLPFKGVRLFSCITNSFAGDV